MSSKHLRRGERAEAVAADFLAEKGYELLERRFSTRRGEVDIIARNAGVLCFVEVRSRRRSILATPEETLTPAKCRRIESAARAYVAQHGLEDSPARFDLVAIDWEGNEPVAIRLHRDAFFPTGG